MINMLVVDDEPEILELITEACSENKDIKLTTTDSAVKAIEEISKNNFKVIIANLFNGLN